MLLPSCLDSFSSKHESYLTLSLCFSLLDGKLRAETPLLVHSGIRHLNEGLAQGTHTYFSNEQLKDIT